VDPLHQAIPAVPDGVEERSDGAEILLYAILFSIMTYAYSPTPSSNRFSLFITLFPYSCRHLAESAKAYTFSFHCGTITTVHWFKDRRIDAHS